MSAHAGCKGYSHNVLSNTNDGTFAGFQPVLQLLVELAPLRSPPNARISVNLQACQGFFTGIVGELKCYYYGYAAMPRHEISLGEFTTGQVSTSASPRMTQLNLVAPPGFSFPTLCAWTAKDVERWTWQRCKSGQKRVKRLIFDIFDGFCELQSCFWFVMMVSGLINIKGSRITIICQETIRYLITPRCC